MFCLDIIESFLCVDNSIFMSSSSSSPKIDDFILWRPCVGHVSFRKIHDMLKEGLVSDSKVSVKNVKLAC